MTGTPTLRKGLTCLVAVMMGAIALAPVAAGSTSGTVAVSLTVPDGCAMDAGALAFGTGSQAEAPLRMRCTPGTSFTVAIDDGHNGVRRMADASGTNFVPYEIYQDALGMQRWGIASGSTVSETAPSDGQVTLAAYGRAARDGAAPGSYSDVVTVTIAF